MLEGSPHRLEARPVPAGGLDFLDPETGRLVAVARLDPPAPSEPVRSRPILEFLFRFRVFRWLEMFLAAFWGIVSILQGRAFAGQQSRLVVRRPDDGEVLLSLEWGPDLFYDSRRVLDASGSTIARFRGHFKKTLTSGFGFGIIDPRRDLDKGVVAPWLGHVEPIGPAYQVQMVGDPEAGTIRCLGDPEGPKPDSYEIVAGPRGRDDPSTRLLLLAVALVVARPIGSSRPIL